MIVGLPVTVLGLYYACPNTHCSVTAWPPTLPASWEAAAAELWDPTAMLVILAWCVVEI